MLACCIIQPSIGEHEFEATSAEFMRFMLRVMPPEACVENKVCLFKKTICSMTKNFQRPLAKSHCPFLTLNTNIKEILG